MNYIRILPGDRVVVELSPYILTRGRITYRYKWQLLQLHALHFRLRSLAQYGQLCVKTSHSF